MNKKTMIILTPGFPANEADSTCLPFPQLFIKSLKELHPALDIIVLAFQYPFTRSEYQWHGITVVSFNGRNRGKLNRLLLWKTAWRRLNKMVKENNVSGILNLWLGECGVVGNYAARKHHLRSFTWLLGQDARKGNRYFSFIRPAPRSLIALSDFLADEFYRNYGILPAHIIPPGMDAGIFRATVTVRDIDILGAGSLTPLKRYDIFIQVVAKLALARPHIKTMICGAGPEKENLQQMINDAGLSGNIKLCGELDHDAVMNLMQRSKVFLHPSSYEGFATVFTEALYAGAHVVGFCEPMHTIFKNQYVVKTEAEMTAKVNALLEDNNLNHDTVITWPIETTCRKISALYGM
ncbi:MAG: hypothetical protein NVSMB7_07210 [Chitinophagaceae bacterium]